eukprot:scaffold12192_cov66-Phaeocystis_antarctica.AAC.1
MAPCEFGMKEVKAKTVWLGAPSARLASAGAVPLGEASIKGGGEGGGGLGDGGGGLGDGGGGLGGG